MTDDRQQPAIEVEVRHALWPGDGQFITRVSSAPFPHDLFYLTDSRDRVSELRPYRLGMFGSQR